jgi:dihydrofolate reductase
MTLSLIVAMDEDRVIGHEGGMPWHLPADLKHFKRTTLGKPVIMGRRTYESIGRPLPDRRNIVLSRGGFEAEGVETAGSLDEALELTKNEEEVMIIGGAGIFEQALPKADRIHLTRIHGHFEGDTRFPPFNHDNWDVIAVEDREADDKNPWPMTFIELHRKR